MKDTLFIFSKFTLLLTSIGIFIFALIMGAADHGGGIKGLYNNLPNTWPWAIQLILVLIALQYKKWGSLLLLLWGLGLVYFFNFRTPNFWWFTFCLTAFFPLLASLYWYSSTKQITSKSR